MARRWQTPLALIPTAWLLSVGATWNGVLNPDIQRLTLLLLAVGVIGWFLLHRQRGWTWHRTALDGVLVGWGVVFALSVAANPDTWRRSAEALWYMLLYILVWYVMADLIANGMRRTAWLNAMLIVGVAQLLIAMLQIYSFYAAGGSGLPRPVGTIGNPNAFGALLVMLIPVAVSSVVTARHHLERGVMMLYTGIMLVVLAATFSRGAWIGAAAALLTLGLFAVASRGLLSVHGVQKWFGAQSTQARVAAVGAVGAILVVMLGLLAAVLLSLGVGGRGADLRTLLWQFALDGFSRHPLFGQGLFTYGHSLPSYWSVPPQQPHSHPHNLPLLILAELGIAGALVGAVTLVLIWRAGRYNWQLQRASDRWGWAGAASGLVGLLVHHLFDTPAMMPAIALTAIVLMTLVVIPVQSGVLQTRWRLVGHPFGMAFLWIGLLVAGLWQSGIMAQDVAILQAAGRTDDDAGAAVALDSVIAQDPQQAAYRWQQAYFYGLAADSNPAYSQQAIQSYERLIMLEPYYAPAYVNLAALTWQDGQPEKALAYARQAQTLAPEWTIARDLATFYSGQTVSPPKVEESPYAPNTAYYQYLRYVFTTELLPQIEQTR